MSWYSKVFWSEGLFLRPHHLQQNDRYVEHLLENRVRQVTPYPWGFSHLEIDRDLAQQSKFALRRAAGVMPDGTPFDIPADSPLPEPIDVPETAAGQIAWLSMPVAAPNTREVDDKTCRQRHPLRPRLGNLHRFDLGAADRGGNRHRVPAPELRTAQDGQARLHRAWHRAHPGNPRQEHPVRRKIRAADADLLGASGDRRLDQPHHRLDREQARRTGALCGRSDIRRRPAKRRLFRAAAAQPADPGTEALCSGRATSIPSGSTTSLLRLAGELATFATPERRARDYPAYDHDDLENVFTPLVRDIQDFLSARLGRRAIRLEIIERAQNAFVSPIRDRSLFRNATLVLEVAARRPLIEIQNQFPHLFKVGPNTKMNEIVHAHLPGVPLVHLPTPPPQIRAITDHVYFYLDRKSPLWPEFSTAGSIGMHFSGDWPDLELELWAILEDRR